MKNKALRKDYITDVIGDGVYRINEFDLDICYLVVGERRALLIDAGTGVGDLMGAVRDITSLPVDVVATHAHPDHVGGAGQFGKVYVNENDICRTNRLMCGRLGRMAIAAFNKDAQKKYGVRMRDVTDFGKAEWIPIEDGHVFDLGGREVRTELNPGHTPGSILLIDDKSRIMFSGDNTARMLWLFLPLATSVEEWILSGERSLELAERYDVYYGHLPSHQTKQDIAETVALAKELVASRNKNSRLFAVKGYPEISIEKPCIMYRPGNVRKKK